MIIYGANIKPLTGELIVTHLIADLGDFNWVHTTMFYAYSPSNSFTLTAGDLTKKLMCSCYKVVSGTVPSNPDKMITMNNSSTGSSRVIRVYDTDYTDATTFKTAVTGQKIVYELATPVTYQLTPTEIRSLLGVNNVWANCGAITELKYTRDLNLCINDIISRIEALEGGSSSRSLSVSPTLTKSLTSDSDKTEGKTEETEEETKEEAQNER